MLKIVKRLMPFVLLGCIVLFYSNEVWRSSKSTNPPTAHKPPEHIYYQSRHDNIFADAWNWTRQDPVSFYTFILALFTGALVCVSFVQIRYLIRAEITARRAAIAARRAANAARKSAEHIPIVERAFIHGGVHPNGREAINDGRNIEIKFSLANYGKTPGFIRYMKFGSCKLEDLPSEPDYREWKVYPVLDLYFPQMKMEEVRTDTAKIVIPADGKHVVFQRVFYDDVFGKPHSSGSVHRMYLNDKGGVGDEVVSGERGAAYWKWD